MEVASSDFLKVLEALREASRTVQSTFASSSGTANSDDPSLRALLALEANSDDLLSGDPHLSSLSHLLSRLRFLASSISGGGGGSAGIFGWRRRSGDSRAAARVAGDISSEIQAWIDRETIHRLVASLRFGGGAAAAASAGLLFTVESRLKYGGFEQRLQHVLLQSGAFSAIEEALADAATPRILRDGCAAAILALVRFNKDVFVGPVLMGPTARSLVDSASPASLRALNGLVAAVRSPLVDELYSRGELPRLVALLTGAGDLEVQILALEFALTIGYYGRKEAVDAMLAQGLIKRLLCLQRSELGGAFTDMDEYSFANSPVKSSDCILAGILVFRRPERQCLEKRPFTSAVARFAVQVEVGEGLRQREKRAAKLQIVKSVREAAASPEEEATVLTEVLWALAP